MACVRKTFGPRQILILLLLLTLILVPRPIAGYLDITTADRLDAAGDYPASAAAYRSAAGRLPWEPELWERAGRAAYFSGDPGSAVGDLERANARGALSPWGWYYLGAAYLELGELDRAEAALKQALPLGEAFWKLAEAERRAGDFAGAITQLRLGLDNGLEDAGAHYALGLLLAATRPEAALPDLMQAAQLDPTLDAPIQSLRTALNTGDTSDDPASRFVYSGQALGALGEWDLAEEAFRNATAADPRSAAAWAWLAEARQQRGLDGGIQMQQALTLNPDLAMVQGLYGLFLQRQGQLEGARTAFLEAVAREPDDAGWQLALAGLSEQTGDLVAARGYLMRAAELAPDSIPAWRALTSFCLRNNVEVATTGLLASRRLIQLAPDDWQSHDLAGQILLETGDRAGAEALLKKAVELDPTQAAPALHLALLYLQMGNQPGAYSYLNLAMAFDPDGPYGQRAARLLEQFFP
jgi:tetratricopeptide (TPR) repeat protein